MIRLCYNSGRLPHRGHGAVISQSERRLAQAEIDVLTSLELPKLDNGVGFISVSRSDVSQGDRELQRPDELRLGPLNLSKMPETARNRLKAQLNKLLTASTDELIEKLSVSQLGTQAADNLARETVSDWLASLKIEDRDVAQVNWQELSETALKPSAQDNRSSAKGLWRRRRTTMLAVAVLSCVSLVFFFALSDKEALPVAPSKSDRTTNAESGARVAAAPQNNSKARSNALAYFEACATNQQKEQFKDRSAKEIESYLKDTFTRNMPQSELSRVWPIPGEAELAARLGEQLKSASPPRTYEAVCKQKAELSSFLGEISALHDAIQSTNLAALSNSELASAFQTLNDEQESNRYRDTFPRPIYEEAEIMVMNRNEKIDAICNVNRYNEVLEFLESREGSEDISYLSKKLLEIWNRLKLSNFCGTL